MIWHTLSLIILPREHRKCCPWPEGKLFSDPISLHVGKAQTPTSQGLPIPVHRAVLPFQAPFGLVCALLQYVRRDNLGALLRTKESSTKQFPWCLDTLLCCEQLAGFPPRGFSKTQSRRQAQNCSLAAGHSTADARIHKHVKYITLLLNSQA